MSADLTDPAAALRAHAKAYRWTIMRQTADPHGRHFWVYAHERIVHVHVDEGGRVAVNGPACPLRDAVEGIFRA